MPVLANREKRQSEEADDDSLARARGFVRGVRSKRPESRLDEEARSRILRDFPEILPGYVRLVTKAPGDKTRLETILC